MLIRAHRQEASSRASIHAVAARCGMTCGSRHHDYGMDLTTREVRQEADRYRETGFRLDVQLEATTAALAQASEIGYDLEPLGDGGPGASSRRCGAVVRGRRRLARGPYSGE